MSELLIPDSITVKPVELLTAAVLAAQGLTRSGRLSPGPAYLYAVAHALAEAAYPNATDEEISNLRQRIVQKGRDATVDQMELSK